MSVLMPHSAPEILASREAKRLVYFHTDHFEPWRSHPTGADEALRLNMDSVAEYGRRMGALDHARLTLFYQPVLMLSEDSGRDLLRVEGDTIGIVPRIEAEDEAATAAFRAASEAVDFEYQVHYHHEYLTWNQRYAPQSEYSKSFAANDVPLNRLRFDLGLDETLKRIASDTGLNLNEKWFFVHGMWALNASDLDVCTITDEIARLQSRGCAGDFTFPAGRTHCDPGFDRPSLVLPVDEPKGYDKDAADPVEAAQAGKKTGKRFFIWASRTTTIDSSLDFFSPNVRANFDDVENWVSRLLWGAYQVNDTLYVKTHAHSMNPHYFSDDSGPGGCFPHEHDSVRRALGMMGDAARARGGDIEYLTASEVHAEIAGRSTKAASKSSGYCGVPERFPRESLETADAIVLKTLTDRLERLGPQEGGLYDHYVHLVGRGAILQPGEILAADIVAAHVPTEMEIVQIGSAAGTLALGLALGGRRIRSFEGARTRFEAQLEALETACLKDPTLRTRFEAVNRSFPAGPELDGRCVLATNATLTVSDDDFNSLLDELSEAEIVIVDALRFLRRLQLGKVGELLESFAKHGLTNARLVGSLGDGGQYYMFSK